MPLLLFLSICFKLLLLFWPLFFLFPACFSGNIIPLRRIFIKVLLLPCKGV